jgi:hypothetical protein
MYLNVPAYGITITALTSGEDVEDVLKFPVEGEVHPTNFRHAPETLRQGSDCHEFFIFCMSMPSPIFISFG